MINERLTATIEQMRTTDPELATKGQVREWAVATYVAWNGWFHSWHWPDDDAEFFTQVEAEAAREARAMRAKIEELEARAEAAEKLRVLLAFRRINNELAELRETED